MINDRFDPSDWDVIEMITGWHPGSHNMDGEPRECSACGVKFMRGGPCDAPTWCCSDCWELSMRGEL